MSVGRTLSIAASMLTASIWVGSLVCLALVANASRDVLSAQARVAFFRRLGRIYGVVGTGCLLFSILAITAIFWPPSELSGAGFGTLALALLLVPLTLAAMLQARTMTVIRRREVEVPGDALTPHRLARGARLAGALRLSIGLVTLAILVIGAHLLETGSA